jgi:hypothetical protein
MVRLAGSDINEEFGDFAREQVRPSEEGSGGLMSTDGSDLAGRLPLYDREALVRDPERLRDTRAVLKAWRLGVIRRFRSTA